ncbi:MAG: hypothetical protein DHS20C06_08740 [Hyphobacterium sp.]|nr:MAG: hypothetical protein DHS20C06_08740 [Hyphobacterium sp.]
MVVRGFWLSLGLLSLALGAVGVFVPLLPTTPFILLAAYCFARSSRRLHHWLLNHGTFGPLIENWNRYGAIARPAKFLGIASLVAVIGLSVLLGAPPGILIIQAFILTATGLFIVSRPLPPR